MNTCIRTDLGIPKKKNLPDVLRAPFFFFALSSRFFSSFFLREQTPKDYTQGKGSTCTATTTPYSQEGTKCAASRCCLLQRHNRSSSSSSSALSSLARLRSNPNTHRHKHREVCCGYGECCLWGWCAWWSWWWMASSCRVRRGVAIQVRGR